MNVLPQKREKGVHFGIFFSEIPQKRKKGVQFRYFMNGNVQVRCIDKTQQKAKTKTRTKCTRIVYIAILLLILRRVCTECCCTARCSPSSHAHVSTGFGRLVGRFDWDVLPISWNPATPLDQDRCNARISVQAIDTEPSRGPCQIASETWPNVDALFHA